jgi:signal transduction histidine kinase
VEVADSGPGVPLALRDRIFQPFFTTKAPGEGTGLGLAMARAIVQRHNGHLEIRERGGRAAFVIDLPADSFAPSKPARYDELALPS